MNKMNLSISENYIFCIKMYLNLLELSAQSVKKEICSDLNKMTHFMYTYDSCFGVWIMPTVMGNQ